MILSNKSIHRMKPELCDPVLNELWYSLLYFSGYDNLKNQVWRPLLLNVMYKVRHSMYNHVIHT